MRVFTLCLLLSSSVHAEPWRAPRPLDDLYARAAADLKSGRPLVVAGYYGLWVDRSDDPDRNLNWGTYYGNARMLRRARKDRHVRKLYRYPNWRLVHEAAAEQDPVRTLVFHQRVRPNARWRAAGVTAPFDAYLVMQAFASQEAAARGMTRNLRRDQGGVIELPDGVRLDVGAAQITGYVGHNLFYDYPDFHWDGLARIPGRPDRAKGVFAIGCHTGRVPGFPELVEENVLVLLFSRSLMAAEGYSTLAVTDAVLRHATSREAVRLANRTYGYFQTLARPRKVGRPFVSHGHGMYPVSPRRPGAPRSPRR